MATAEENLLLGTQAVQLGFVTPDNLVAAVNTWAAAKHRSLAEILVEQQAVSPAACRALTDLVRQQIELGCDFPGAPSLLSPATEPSLRTAFQTLGADRLASTRDHPSPYLTQPLTARPDTPQTVHSREERFRVVRLHARGGLGEVWMAEDADLGREVALKEIRPRHADQPQSRARFVQEAEITGRLEHPGIVPVYALGHHGDGRPYYVMRFIRGRSLQQAIDRHHQAQRAVPGVTVDGRRHDSTRDEVAEPPAGDAAESLPGAEAGSSSEAGASGPSAERPTRRQLLTRFVAACEAVAYAHSRGVLHRDLKPDNIMLGPYGETLVVDWGLAKADGQAPLPPAGDAPLESLLKVSSGTPTQLGSALGTPGYMSPEQARGEIDRLTPATDVYSLGATLYCILCGVPPCLGNDLGEVLQQTISGVWTAPRQVDASIARPLDAICQRALAVEPGDRYATASDLAADIQRYLDDEPVVAHRDTLAERTGRWVRRHKSGVAVGALALVLTAAVAVVAAIQIGRSRDEALDLAARNADLATAEASAREVAQLRQQEAEEATARAQRYYELAIQTVDDFLTNVSEDERLMAFGLETLRRDLLSQARDFYELVIEEAQEGQDPLFARRADAHRRLADIGFEVGDFAAAIEDYTQAMQHLVAQGTANGDPESYVNVANGLALAFAAAGQSEAAVKLWRVLDESIGKMIAEQPDNVSFYALLATVRLNLALQIESQDPLASIELSQAAKQSIGEAIDRDSEDWDLRDTLALIHNNLASTLLAQERYDDASRELEVAELVWETLRQDADGWLADQLDDQLALCYLNQASIASQRSAHEQVEALLTRALALREQLARRRPDAVQLQERLADLHRMAIPLYRESVRYQEALAQAEEALSIYRQLVAAHPEVPVYKESMADTWVEQGLALIGKGALPQSIAAMESGVQLGDQLVAHDPDRSAYRLVRAQCRYHHGLALLEAAQPSQAAAALAAAIAEFAAIRPQQPEDFVMLVTLADCQATLAMIYDAPLLNRPAEAQAWWEQTRQTAATLLAEPLIDRLPPTIRSQAYQCRALASTYLGSHAKALEDWETAAFCLGKENDFGIGVGKATTLLEIGRVAEALQLAGETAAAQQHPGLVYAIARELALAPPSLAAGEQAGDLQDRQQQTEQILAASVATLRLAAERNYFAEPAARQFLDEDAYLEAIRDRADFVEFCRSLPDPPDN
jgi:eukaryotic-like serine/threonine-protein kinase